MTLSILFALACATTPNAPTAEAAAAAAAPPPVEIASDIAPASTVDTVTMREARHNVDVLIARLADADPRTVLRTPETAEDVLQVLRSDRLDLFEAGVATAHALKGRDARALEAQLEFAWAEALLGTGALYGEVAETTTDADLARDYRRMEQSLGRVATEHMETGAILTRRLLAAVPDDYVGYRVALDHHRLVQDWDRFDAAVSAVQTLNADSVGLKFQKGAAAWDRDHDGEVALAMLQLALEADPEFTRAQALVIGVSEDPSARCQAFVRLAAMSPHHQLVQLLQHEFAELCYAEAELE